MHSLPIFLGARWHMHRKALFVEPKPRDLILDRRTDCMCGSHIGDDYHQDDPSASRSVLILASALLFNNIQRRFPLHWWTPESLLPTVREKDDGSTTDANEENPSSLTLNEDKASDDVQIMIKAGQISVTDSIILTPDEKEFLERLSRRI
ncbi:hypothetical protein CISG_07676 [Coccidioides immitis RMSCC 3703]|uniref:Uncharacterized protein n=1 Tax=Coccidioides immitis RMSCC 3703 TaxID=454286 RepID=A0A0J8R4A1_COCIT|nr:hypothetical protein CISG_07676 [Coccidioides immitis RMSCC 3703]